MRVLVLEKGYSPYEAFFQDGGEAISKIIKGRSKVLHPFPTEDVALVCSENQEELSPNRTIDDRLIVHGRFFICGWDADSGSIQELGRATAKKYDHTYFCPEKFEMKGNQVFASPLPPCVKPVEERLGKKHWFRER